MSTRPPGYTINVHHNGEGQQSPDVAVDTYASFVSVRIGRVSFFLDDLAAAADLNERLGIAITAAMLDAAQAETLPLDGAA